MNWDEILTLIGAWVWMLVVFFLPALMLACISMEVFDISMKVFLVITFGVDAIASLITVWGCKKEIL